VSSDEWRPPHVPAVMVQEIEGKEHDAVWHLWMAERDDADRQPPAPSAA